MSFLPSRSTRLSRDAQRLLSLAQSLSQSGCRVEDIYWENLMATHLAKLLQGRHNRTIETTLDHMLEHGMDAYEVLAEQAETVSESTELALQSAPHDVLLVTAPILAWTRYQLPSVTLDAAVQQAIIDSLAELIVAPQARVAIIPRLVSFDQMPQSFQETWAWTQRLGQQALGLSSDPCPLRDNPEPDNMLADTRFLVAAIATPKGEPIFRWQTTPDSIGPARDTCLKHWQERSQQLLAPLFTGCQTEFLLPDAFYISSREADRRIRPLAVKAAVAWLQTATSFDAADLRATIVACGQDRIEEFRVGFCPSDSNDVIYGCVWPVLSREEAQLDGIDGDRPDVPDEIAGLLRELGLREIKRLPGIQHPEFCDDCGAPYFPNPLGEMLHPELPEEAVPGPVHFH